VILSGIKFHHQKAVKNLFVEEFQLLCKNSNAFYLPDTNFYKGKVIAIQDSGKLPKTELTKN